MNMSIRDVERCLLGSGRTTPDRDVAAVRTDSRAVRPGDLFVCIEGERFDGHEFADQALKSGAQAVISEKLMFDLPEDKVIMVPSSVAALGRIAACHREKSSARVAAVTGSAGKTTVKEMLAAALSGTLRVARNAGNLNNQIGLPMSMLEAHGDEDVWVMEVGISKPGDMDELGPVARPDLALITNVCCAHAEGLGNLRDVARAKASLLRHLKPGGRAVVCMDYPELWEEASLIRPDLTGFSTKNPAAFCRASQIGAEPDGRGRYRLEIGAEAMDAVLPFSGPQFAESLAAAACAAHLLGVSLEDMAPGLATFRLPGQRFCRKRAGAHLLIDDTYNANPLSMDGAVRAAADQANGAPLVLVLGEMRELGAASDQAHRDLGALAAEAGAIAVFFKGAASSFVEDGLERAGFTGIFRRVDDPSAFIGHWRELGIDCGVVLFKGSRSLCMEDFFQALARELLA